MDVRHDENQEVLRMGSDGLVSSTDKLPPTW